MSASTTISVPLPERCVSFVLDSDLYGVDVLRVREVLPRPPLTTVPGAGDLCVGVLNLRGRILTVLDLRRLLGVGAQTTESGEHLLVVERGGRFIGLLVDSVGDVLRLDPHADVAAQSGDTLGVMAMVHHQGRFVALLALDRLLEGAA